jgi:hypothetical protein
MMTLFFNQCHKESAGCYQRLIDHFIGKFNLFITTAGCWRLIVELKMKEER